MNSKQDLTQSSNKVTSLWTRLMISELRNIKSDPIFSKLLTFKDEYIHRLHSMNFIFDKAKSTIESASFYSQILNYINKHATNDLRRLPTFIEDLASGNVCMKSLNKAKQFRENGNQFFRFGDLSASASAYRSGLLHAPNAFPKISASHDEQALQEAALLHGNLSAVLFSQSHWLDCVDEIVLAMKLLLWNNQIESSNCKVIGRLKLRMFKCFEYLRIKCDCIIQLEDDLTRDRLSQLEELIGNIRTEGKHDVGLYPFNKLKIPQPRYGSQHEFSGLSDGVRIIYTQSKGRHVVAEKEFAIGDVIAVEPAGGCDPTSKVALCFENASILLPSERMNRCYACLEELTSIRFVCPYCCDAAYCCVQSVQNWDTQPIWHVAECRFMFLLNSIGLGHLCFRLAWFAQRNNNGLMDNIVHNLSAINQLVDHFSKFKWEELVEYALTAWLIAKLLIHSIKLVNEHRNGTQMLNISPSIGQQDEMVIGLWCFDTLRRLQCNAHATVDIQFKSPNLDDDIEWKRLGSLDRKRMMNIMTTFQQIRIASSIYPSVSMLNHACDPNVINEFQGTFLILHCLKPIHPGEEVFNCYGPHYIHNPSIRMRRTQLREQYYFHCDCKHCSSFDTRDYHDHYGDSNCEDVIINQNNLLSKWKHVVDKLNALSSNPMITELELVYGIQNLCDIVLSNSDPKLPFKPSSIYTLWPDRELCFGSVLNQIGKKFLFLYCSTQFKNDNDGDHDDSDSIIQTMGFSCLIISIKWTRKVFGLNSLEYFWQLIHCLRLVVLNHFEKLTLHVINETQIPVFDLYTSLSTLFPPNLCGQEDEQDGNIDDHISFDTSNDLIKEIKRLSLIHFSCHQIKLNRIMKKFIYDQRSSWNLKLM